MISVPVRLSRFPVGSSASRSFGRLISARARAVLCCSPPESSLGRWSMRARKPTRSKASRARPCRLVRSTSANLSGSSTFSATVMLGIRLNDWKTMPTTCKRYLASSSRESFARSRSCTTTLPEVGRSRPAIRFSTEDLPEPELPRRATKSPAQTSSDTPSTARIRVSPMR